MSGFEHGPHHRHFGFGPMGGGGGGMGMGFGVRRGEFRFLILISLSEKPMHGYALIQEIGRTYQRPVSAGLVYPSLQELEDMGFVTSKEKDGKKIYSITAQGKSYLKDNEDVVSRLKAGKEYADRIGQFSLMRNLKEIQATVMWNSEEMDEKKMERIQEVLVDAKKRIFAIVFESQE